MLEEEELKDAALCIFANKQDLPGALTAPQVAFIAYQRALTHKPSYSKPKI